MRRFGTSALLMLAMLLLPALAAAQTTTVTATITDSDAQTWNNGKAIITFVPTPGVSGPFYVDGVLMTDAQKGPFSSPMNGGGTFTQALTDNNHISPAGSMWLFTLCSNTSAACSPVTLPVTGTSVNLSITLSSKVTAPRFPAKGTGYYGYSDTEVNQIPGPGGSYFNVSSACLRVWNGSVFNCATGGSPGGANPQVQFNDGGNFGGDSRVTFNKSTGALTDTGSFVAGTINNIVTVDGTKYATATGALADPACSQASNAGCTIDMRGNSSPAALNLGTFDPGSSAPAIQLLLGPFVYHATQIVLRNGLHISGTNSGGGVGASPSTPSPPPTEIISNDTTTPMVVLGGTTAILGVNMEHFRLYCGAGNTSQIGLNIVAQHSFPASSGLWWSSFNDMFVGGDGVHECLGNPAVFDGNDAGSGNVNGAALNQFISFRDMRFFRGTNGGPVLITGLNGQFTFEGPTEFDGPTPRDNNHVNLVINDGTETFRPPYTFTFTNLTVQQAWGATGRCMQINGVKGLIISGGHFENCNGGVQLAVGNHYGNKGVVIQSSTFDTNTGIDGGNGYILSMDSGSQVDFIGNTIDGTPDTAFAGDVTYLFHDPTLNAGNGLPYASPSTISRFRFPLGFDSDSPAFKFGVVTFTGLTAGSRASVNFPFTTPFPDNNYICGCTVDDFTTAGTSQGLVGERINGVPAAGSFNYTVFNPTGGTLNGNLYCWAWHP